MPLHPRHSGVEFMLERNRPAHCLSRSQCVFFARSRDDVSALGVPTTHIYAVQPVGAVQRSDMAWWHKIAHAHSQTPQERPEGVDDWVAQYWAGSECPTGTPLWEYRAEAIRL